MSNERPVIRQRVGNISVSGWANSHNGRQYLRWSIQSHYKDGDDWKTSNSIDHRDAGNAVLCFQMAVMRGVSWLAQQNERESNAGQ